MGSHSNATAWLLNLLELTQICFLLVSLEFRTICVSGGQLIAGLMCFNNQEPCYMIPYIYFLDLSAIKDFALQCAKVFCVLAPEKFPHAVTSRIVTGI